MRLRPHPFFFTSVYCIFVGRYANTRGRMYALVNDWREFDQVLYPAVNDEEIADLEHSASSLHVKRILDFGCGEQSALLRTLYPDKFIVTTDWRHQVLHLTERFCYLNRVDTNGFFKIEELLNRTSWKFDLIFVSVEGSIALKYFDKYRNRLDSDGGLFFTKNAWSMGMEKLALDRWLHPQHYGHLVEVR